jgi:hypothetical protein
MNLKSGKSHQSTSSFLSLGPLSSELRNKDGDGSRIRIILLAAPLSQSLRPEALRLRLAADLPRKHRLKRSHT